MGIAPQIIYESTSSPQSWMAWAMAINSHRVQKTPTARPARPTKGEKLTSRAFKAECLFEWGYLVESVKRIVNGKERRFQNKTPLSFILAPQADGTGSGGSSSGGSSGGGTNTGGNTGGGGDNGGGGDDDENT